MSACNSDKCHCPRCMREKRYVTAEQVDDLVERKLKAERDHRSYLRSRAEAGRIFTSRNRDGATLRWVWHRLPIGWQRKDIKTGRLFGPVVPRGPYTGKSWDWSGPVVTDGTMGRIIEETVTLRAGRLSKTTTTVFERPAESDIKQEETLLTPLKLSILLWRASHSEQPYPFNDHDTAAIVRLKLRQLDREGLISFVGEGESYAYVLTDRARVLIEAIKALPLPVQKPAPWVMPS